MNRKAAKPPLEQQVIWLIGASSGIGEALVHQLADPGQLHLTVLNFSGEPVTGTVRSEFLAPGAEVSDMFTSRPLGTVDDLHSFSIEMEPHQGHSLLVAAPAVELLTPA